ncbi:MAG TPA: biotin/lipoyl-binding protein [Bryobacteraceae bacterium]|nr:biotin/lipoyl-binding protein [Bryobacteraceae bacterium]
MNTDTSTKSRKLPRRLVSVGMAIAAMAHGLDVRKLLGRLISIGIVGAAVALGLAALYNTNYNPRTDDAEVFANFIGIAPQVEGPITRLNVRDNQFAKQGELLFEIDERPYRYALEKALSEQAALEGQIEDERRKIAALVSGVSVAQANIQGSQADINRWAAAVDQARADVANSEQGVNRAKAEWTYSNNNLHRIEPLLEKQFVTVDQVDRARTSEIAQAEALKQAASQLQLSQAGLKSALAQYEHSKAVLEQSKAQHQQSTHAVTTLEPLVNQRGARASAVETARYSLNNCRVYAPFDTRVTNLTISEGAYAHVGQQVFTLIDARTWWAIGNFREGKLQHIVPGMRADVYVLSKPNVRFSGVVDSIGFGVTPDADVIGRLGPGLPDVQRTLNWVHLATRYPVRVRVKDPPPELFRVSESAVVVIRGH